MKVKDMIERLQKLNPELEITILDGFNGGGQPRDINLGPQEWDPKGTHTFNGDERQDYSDISSEEGTVIVVMGYGSY